MNSPKLPSINFAFVLLLALTLSACGPAKYKLNGGKDKKGDSIRTESKMTLSDANLSIGSASGRVSGKMDMRNHSINVTKTLDTDDKGASAIEVFHEADLAVFDANINGQKNTNEQKSPLHGTTIIRRRTGDTWSDALKDATPTPEQKKRLDAGARGTPSQYPDRELTVGESWTVAADLTGEGVGLAGCAANCGASSTAPASAGNKIFKAVSRNAMAARDVRTRTP